MASRVNPYSGVPAGYPSNALPLTMALERNVIVLACNGAADTELVDANVSAVVMLMIAAYLRNPDFGPNIWSLSHNAI